METVMNRPDQNDVVILELDRPRELTLSHRALKRFSALTGCSMADLDQEIQHYEKMSALLWVMVTDEQMDLNEPLMTPDALDALLNKHKVRIKTVMDVCAQAIKAAFDDENAEDAGPGEGSGDPPQTAAGAGAEA